MFDLSEKNISRVRNRFETSGSAIGIFSICRRVAALRYIHFSVFCCCLFLVSTSVLVRVLHPYLVLRCGNCLMLLRGCGCFVLMVNANPGL